MMHGPGVSETPGACSPTWGTRPMIPVLDSMVRTLRLDRRPFWRQGRDGALDLWRTSKVIGFTVMEDRDPVRFNGDNLHDLMEPDRLVIVHNGAGGGDSGGWFDGADPNPIRGGILVLSPWRPWWKDYWRKSLSAVVAHEIGHCLGFGHTTQGGLMGGGRKPSDHELESVRAYYGGTP